MTPHQDYFGQNFAKLKHSDVSSPILLGAINFILTRTQTSQVLDCTKKFSIIELEIQIVRYQSTVSCLQVTEAVSDQRDTYTHISSEQPLTVEYSKSDHALLHITRMSYPYHHMPWLRGQPINIAYNDLHSIQLLSL